MHWELLPAQAAFSLRVGSIISGFQAFPAFPQASPKALTLTPRSSCRPSCFTPYPTCHGAFFLTLCRSSLSSTHISALRLHHLAPHLLSSSPKSPPLYCTTISSYLFSSSSILPLLDSQWLGKNSTTGKFKRLTQELVLHSSLAAGQVVAESVMRAVYAA